VDGIAIWDALEEHQRAQILAKLTAAAAKKAIEVKDLYASNFGDPPTIEVIDCAREGTALRIHYLFEWWEWCAAQSGSDWNYHKVYSGSALFDGGALRTNEMTERRSNYVHESSEDSYDRAAEVQAVRDELARSI
jgi:hypothetical protein